MDLSTFFMFLALLNEGSGGGGGGGGGGVSPSPSPVPPTPGPTPSPVPPTPGPTPFVPPPPGVLPQPIPHFVPIKPQPFPAPVQPQNLPPFPGPQWTPCPTTAAITARAAYWNPILWNYASKTIRQPIAQEQLGGTWVTFKAAWHPGDNGPQTYMATEAYCLGALPGPAPGPAPGPTPEHPGVNYSYTGQPQDPATQQEWAQKLASVDPYDIQNAWIVRMFQWAVGLTQNSYPGVDSVTPSGTDGRYGHDTHAALAKLVPNAPPVAPTRPAWWGPPGTYTNPGEPAPPPGGMPPESAVSATQRGKAPAPKLKTLKL